MEFYVEIIGFGLDFSVYYLVLYIIYIMLVCVGIENVYLSFGQSFKVS